MRTPCRGKTRLSSDRCRKLPHLVCGVCGESRQCEDDDDAFSGKRTNERTRYIPIRPVPFYRSPRAQRVDGRIPLIKFYINERSESPAEPDRARNEGKRLATTRGRVVSSGWTTIRKWLIFPRLVSFLFLPLPISLCIMPNRDSTPVYRFTSLFGLSLRRQIKLECP